MALFDFFKLNIDIIKVDFYDYSENINYVEAISIAKNINFMLGLFQRACIIIDKKYTPKIRFNGISLKNHEEVVENMASVSGVFDINRKYISTANEQIFDLIVNKEIHEFIPSIKLLKILLLLTNIGCDLLEITFFLNQPIIFCYLYLIARENSNKNAEAITEIKKKVIKEFKGNSNEDEAIKDYFDVRNGMETGLNDMIEEWRRQKNGKRRDFEGHNKTEQYAMQRQIFREFLKMDIVANEYFSFFEDMQVFQNADFMALYNRDNIFSH